MSNENVINLIEKYGSKTLVEKNKTALLDAFVSVYGEKYREIMADRFSKIKFISYYTEEDISRFCINLEQQEVKKLTVEFLEKCGIELNEEERDTILNLPEYKYSPELKNNLEILQYVYGDLTFKVSNNRYKNPFVEENEYLELPERTQEKIKKDKSDLLNFIASKYGCEVTDTQVMDEFNKIKTVVNEIDEEYKKFLLEYSMEFEENARCEIKKEEIIDKNNEQYLQELLKIVPEEHIEQIKKRLEKGDSDTVYLASSVCYESNIEAFSQEKEDMLNAEENVYLIKLKRIEYFKKMGIDKGYDAEYEDYIEDEQCKAIIPSKELANRVSKLRRQFKEKVDKEILLEASSYETNNEQYKSLNSYEHEVTENEMNELIIQEKRRFTAIEFKRNGDTLENMPIIYIPLFSNYDANFFDIWLIHEIGHALEMDEKVEEKDGIIKAKTGLELFEEDINDSKTDEKVPESKRKKRKYELLSENIHHQLSQEVARVFHSKGNFLLNNNQEIIGSSSYEYYNSIVNPVFNVYKQGIIDGMMTIDGYYELDKQIGLDKLEKLNDNVREVATMGAFRVTMAICQGKEDENTRRYKELIESSKQIANSIKESGKTDGLLASAIRLTEKVTRDGQIVGAVTGMNNRVKTDNKARKIGSEK